MVSNNVYSTFDIRYVYKGLVLVYRAVSDVGDTENNDERSESEHDPSRFVSRESRQNNNQGGVKVMLALLYKRTSKEGRQGNPPTITTCPYIHFIYHPRIIPHAPMYHPDIQP